MKRLGVLGTFVWDRIWTLEDRAAGRPFESWGGVAYALAAASAACPAGWEIVPLARVGEDLAEEARAFAAALPGVDAGPGLVAVPVPNNRVELRYTDAASRHEIQSGGVGAWPWEELAPRVSGLDALYVNYLSGFELDLTTTERLRAAFGGPIYADLHSLFLGPPGAGARAMRRLPEWERWVASFDAVQLNDDELAMLGSPHAEPAEVVRGAVAAGVGAVIVTHGAGGASLARRAGFPADPRAWPGVRRRAGQVTEAARFAARPAPGDPTGCGDVWGATCFASLLSGRGWEDAIATAHAAAARKMGIRGASHLHAHLVA